MNPLVPVPLWSVTVYVSSGRAVESLSPPTLRLANARKADVALNTSVFGADGSMYSVPGTFPIGLGATMVTSCTVVVLNPYSVRSAAVNALLKETVKPVAVGWKPPAGTTNPWTVMGALKPVMGGAAAVV